MTHHIATTIESPEITPAKAKASARKITGVQVERLIGVGILVALVLLFIFVPIISPYASTDVVADPLSRPGAGHLFGTDQLGRDVFVRVFEAGRIDLALIVVSITISAILGTTVGLIGAYLPGIGRAIISRITDAAMAFPYIVLVIGLAAALGNRELIPGLPRGTVAISIAIIIACWPAYARLTMTRAVILRGSDAVIAARVLGYSPLRILARHLAPQLLPMTLSYAATQAVATTALVGSIAFLGVGIAPPTPELGQMMADSISLLSLAWWPSIIPGLVILALGIGFALLADSARERKM